MLRWCLSLLDNGLSVVIVLYLFTWLCQVLAVAHRISILNNCQQLFKENEIPEDKNCSLLPKQWLKADFLWCFLHLFIHSINFIWKPIGYLYLTLICLVHSWILQILLSQRLFHRGRGRAEEHAVVDWAQAWAVVRSRGRLLLDMGWITNHLSLGFLNYKLRLRRYTSKTYCLAQST